MPVAYRSNIQRLVDTGMPRQEAPRKDLTAADFIQHRKVPTRGAPMWEPDEIAKLRRLASQELTPKQIAERLGRTPRAVSCRASIEGISLHYSSRLGVSVKQWSAEDDERLRRMADDKASRAAMRAAFPNRTNNAIGYRLWQMGYRRKK